MPFHRYCFLVYERAIFFAWINVYENTGHTVHNGEREQFCKEERFGVYSFENEAKKLSESFEKIFKSNKTAWDFFIAQAPSYQKAVIHWVMTARQEKTQLLRLEKIIAESGQHKKLWDKYK